MADGVYLNLGAGGQIADGWFNVDLAFTFDSETYAVARGGRVTYPTRGLPSNCMLLDLADEWPWKDGAVDGIVMHHVLDLLDDDGVNHVLGEARRVLREEAALRISLADIDKAIRKAQAGEWDWFPEPVEVVCGSNEGDLDKEATLGFFITQGGARNQHFTPDSLLDALAPHGLRCDWLFGRRLSTGPVIEKMYELDSRESESFFVTVWWTRYRPIR
jgi:SAM-dependent methyltransferase